MIYFILFIFFTSLTVNAGSEIDSALGLAEERVLKLSLSAQYADRRLHTPSTSERKSTFCFLVSPQDGKPFFIYFIQHHIAIKDDNPSWHFLKQSTKIFTEKSERSDWTIAKAK